MEVISMTINEKLDAMDKKLDIIQDLLNNVATKDDFTNDIKKIQDSLNNVATKDDLKDEVEEIKEKSHESSQDLIFLIFLIVLIVIH
jgi:hypothetical protein